MGVIKGNTRSLDYRSHRGSKVLGLKELNLPRV